MESSELIALIVVLAVVGLFVYLLRRASEKQAAESAEAVRERLKEAGDKEAEADQAPRAGRSKPLPKEEPREKLESEEEGAEKELEDEASEAAELKKSLSKTRSGFVAKLGRIFARKTIDKDILSELEEVLFTADIGPKTADKIFQAIKSALSRDELGDPKAVWAKIREETLAILDVKAEPVDFSGHRPFVLLTIGVNGVGKTTTIGKLAAKLTAEGKKVLLGAGDTFRAAAVEQLEIWGQRAGVEVIKGKDGGDPSSVIFDTIKRGVTEGYDVVICDTAGRLHTKVDLMQELKKIGRVSSKALEGAPHETWLVLDATTGQNAIQQAEMFKDAMNISGIVLTKLDGTAKGGVILGICDELKVPVRYIGIGERVEDLREFDANAFVAALYEDAEPDAA